MPARFTPTISTTFADSAGGTQQVTQIAISADSFVGGDVVWASAPTNLLVNYAFKLAEIQAISIRSTAITTIKTNSSGSPDTTIANLPANTSLIWYPGILDGSANPFGSVDVTKLYITSAATAGTLSIKVYLNASA